MAADDIQTWETDVLDCPSASAATFITKLHGGESITIKSLAANTQYHYIGTKDRANASKGYKLRGTDTMTMGLPLAFGENKAIEVWALPSNAGDDITFFKLTGIWPSTEASV